MRKFNLILVAMIAVPIQMMAGWQAISLPVSIRSLYLPVLTGTKISSAQPVKMTMSTLPII